MPSPPQGASLFRFGVFTLDAERGELRRESDRVPLQDKPLQLLSLLVEHPGQLVTREEIRQKLWGVDTFVEFDDSLNHAVRKLREALGDSAEAPLFIKTIPRQGYRFLARVQTERRQTGNGELRIVPPASADLTIRGRGGARRRMLIGLGILLLLVSAFLAMASWRNGSPSEPAPASMLVLPFRSLDAGAEGENIGEGISEQVTARLMNLKGLRLVSPEVAYRVNASGRDPTEAGKRLNAEAVLVGSVRTAENRIRINAQLIRTADSRILWADGGLEVEARNLLEAERVLSAAIATRLRGALTSTERGAMTSTPTSNAEAYELFVRGKLAMRDWRRGDGLRVAEQLFEQAIRLDPTFAEALGWLAMAQATRFQIGFAGDELRRGSIGNARKAIAIDPSAVMARRALISIFHTTGQAEEGLREAAILRKSDATDPVSLSAIADAYLRAGMPDRAVPFFEQALQMDPEDTAIPGSLAFTAYWAGQYELGLRVLEHHPLDLTPLPSINLAVTAGRREVARSVAFQAMRDPATMSLTVAFAGLILRDLGEGEMVRQILQERLPAYENRAANLRNERLRIGIGLGHCILGNKRRARDQVRLALETNPGDPWTLFYSSEIYAQSGDNRQAIDYLREAIVRGFLSLHYLEWPHLRLYDLRAHPEVRALRDGLLAKIGRLRKLY
jgi:DNA-binding winged helix-turn-helix (wHTH) protein/TolB-like protein